MGFFMILFLGIVTGECSNRGLASGNCIGFSVDGFSVDGFSVEGFSVVFNLNGFFR